MQFLPAEWAQYGVDANGDGFKDPYNPADAIFAAARYLRAAGGSTNIKGGRLLLQPLAGVRGFGDAARPAARRHADGLLGAITGLTEARFPVHAASHFSDGFPSVPAGGSGAPKTLVGHDDLLAGGRAGDRRAGRRNRTDRRLAHARALRVAARRLREHLRLRPARQRRGALPGARAARSPGRERPHRSARRSGRTGSERPGHRGCAGRARRCPNRRPCRGSRWGLPRHWNRLRASLRRRANRRSRRRRRKPSAPVRAFREGSNEVYLHPLRAGVQVIAGTVLGHVGGEGAGRQPSPASHMLFQIRPAGVQAPLIDPKPILDGWVALENTSIFRAKGENPFLATSPTVGQVLLESKRQLEPQVLHDRGIRLARCGRQDIEIRSGRQARARDARVPVGVGTEADGGRAALQPKLGPRRGAQRVSRAPARMRWTSPP